MSLEFNKVAGAFLGTLTFVLGTSFIAELIFDQEAPETPGFEIVVADAAEAGGEAEAAPEVAPIAVRLLEADVARGEGLNKACAACHAFDSSGANKVGPGLWETVGRQPGTHEGFNYSAAMVEYGQTHQWTYENLDAFLANPKGTVPGTKMAYAGMRKPEDRADLIAYLRSLSNSPQPLPTTDSPAEVAPAEPAPAPAQ